MEKFSTAKKVIYILDIIAKNPEGVTLTEIANELMVPKTSTFDILQQLLEMDAIYYKNQQLKTYAIGSKIYQIGQSYAKYSKYINTAEPFLKAYSEKYGVTTFASKHVDDRVVYVFKHEPQSVKIVTTENGSSFPYSDSLDWKVILAYDRKAEKTIDKMDFSLFHNPNIKTKSDFMKVLEKIREKGYVIENGEVENYIRTIGCPIWNHTNQVIGVVSQKALYLGINEENLQEQINELQEIARNISRLLGYQPI